MPCIIFNESDGKRQKFDKAPGLSILDIAHKKGQAAGRESLKGAKGSQGEKLFSNQDVVDAYNPRTLQNKYVKEDPNKPYHKRKNPKVAAGKYGTGKHHWKRSRL